MRENIGIFRGKDTIEHKWRYGNLTVHGDTAQIWEDTEQGLVNYLVDPGTVGEFTGLTDKNGVKIFEGDKVEYNGAPHEVVFCDFAGNAYFGIWFTERGEIWSFSPETPADRMAVIGNVHDDPQLRRKNGR